MSTVEVNTKEGIKKYEFIDEDIDTMLVSSEDIELSEDGFRVRINPIWSEEKKCIVVDKRKVIAHYHDWVKERFYFLGFPCTYERLEHGIRVILFDKPTEHIDEFVYRELWTDRGEDFPPIISHKYCIDTTMDDERLQRVVEENHRDYGVYCHGITPNMGDEERTKLIVEYVKERIVTTPYVQGFELFNNLLLGRYGYTIPDRRYSTNIDLIFDEVIPYVYDKCKNNGPYSGSNILRDLQHVIVNGYCALDVFCGVWIEEGKRIYPNKNYLFFMYIKFHLKLIEVHKKNISPYNLLNLKNVSYWLEERCGKYLENHDKVIWNGNVVCEDIGKFVKESMKELKYFRRFAK